MNRVLRNLLCCTAATAPIAASINDPFAPIRAASLHADAQRHGRRPRREDGGDDEERSEQSSCPVAASPAEAIVDCARAEDQHRHVERQDKEREQHAAAAQSRASAPRRWRR